MEYFSKKFLFNPIDNVFIFFIFEEHFSKMTIFGIFMPRFYTPREQFLQTQCLQQIVVYQNIHLQTCSIKAKIFADYFLRQKDTISTNVHFISIFYYANFKSGKAYLHHFKLVQNLNLTFSKVDMKDKSTSQRVYSRPCIFRKSRLKTQTKVFYKLERLFFFF